MANLLPAIGLGFSKIRQLQSHRPFTGPAGAKVTGAGG
jgi:hypothetical protein